jgi:hypothetical protein
LASHKDGIAFVVVIVVVDNGALVKNKGPTIVDCCVTKALRASTSAPTILAITVKLH